MNNRGTSIGQGNLVDPSAKFKMKGNTMAAIQMIEFTNNNRFFSAFVMGHLCVDFPSVSDFLDRRMVGIIEFPKVSCS
jgi:hypothetical protein